VNCCVDFYVSHYRHVLFMGVNHGGTGDESPRIGSGGTLIQVPLQIFFMFQNFKRSPWIRPHQISTQLYATGTFKLLMFAEIVYIDSMVTNVISKFRGSFLRFCKSASTVFQFQCFMWAILPIIEHRACLRAVKQAIIKYEHWPLEQSNSCNQEAC
jgi:hypothetical protein